MQDIQQTNNFLLTDRELKGQEANNPGLPDEIGNYQPFGNILKKPERRRPLYKIVFTLLMAVILLDTLFAQHSFTNAEQQLFWKFFPCYFQTILSYQREYTCLKSCFQVAIRYSSFCAPYVVIFWTNAPTGCSTCSETVHCTFHCNSL